MLGMTSCAKPRNSCPEFPIPTHDTISGILDYAGGDADILGWVEVNQEILPLPIYQQLLLTYKPHPEAEAWMSRILKLWDKLDERNK